MFEKVHLIEFLLLLLDNLSFGIKTYIWQGYHIYH